jgi:integrase/recombinase XerD
MAEIDPTLGRSHWVVSPEMALEHWMSCTSLSTSTRKAYSRYLRNWLSMCQETSLDPFQARPVHMEAFITTVSERSRPNACAALASFYGWAAVSDYTPRDLSVGMRRPSKPAPRPGTWATPAEMRRMLILCADDPPDSRALAAILILTGMRVSEAVGIDVDGITPGTAAAPMKILVRRKLGHVDEVGVAPEIDAAVTPLLEKRRTGPLLRKGGRRMSRDTALDQIKRLGERAECAQNITPHSLRRSFVTFARDLGVSDIDIMAATGHRTVEMLDVYDRGRRQHEAAASLAISRSLRK